MSVCKHFKIEVITTLVFFLLKNNNPSTILRIMISGVGAGTKIENVASQQLDFKWIYIDVVL